MVNIRSASKFGMIFLAIFTTTKKRKIPILCVCVWVGGCGYVHLLLCILLVVVEYIQYRSIHIHQTYMTITPCENCDAFPMVD